MVEDKWDKTKIVLRTQEEIDDYNTLIGYRRARMKRYGKSSSSRKRKSTLKNN